MCVCLCQCDSIWMIDTDNTRSKPNALNLGRCETMSQSMPVCSNVLFCSRSNPGEAALIGRAKVAQSLPSQARLLTKHRVVDQNKGSHHVVLQHC